ncbi:Aste57867_14237 [Aphanomyces stellatus]|uniref:Aste57867_14237 protein n=1 Tax=Aphanomyces stellatus TaxID=120398 RepID=A0A485L102_9STRA|nr:hypothetical protein As57867_014186 [Aphanomyces stellatus]VFT91062.1 Aste57867_14237 [Aphanomyces stellatus]
MPLRYFDSVDELHRWGHTFPNNEKLHRCRIALRIAAMMVPHDKDYGLALLVDAANTMEPEELTKFAVNAYHQDDPSKVVVAFITDFPELVNPAAKVVHREYVGQLLVCDQVAWGRRVHQMGHDKMHKLVVSGRYEKPRLLYSTTAELMQQMHASTENAEAWQLKELFAPSGGWY